MTIYTVVTTWQNQLSGRTEEELQVVDTDTEDWAPFKSAVPVHEINDIARAVWLNWDADAYEADPLSCEVYVHLGFSSTVQYLGRQLTCYTGPDHINLTPHNVTVWRELDEETEEVPPEGAEVREGNLIVETVYRPSGMVARLVEECYMLVAGGRLPGPSDQHDQLTYVELGAPDDLPALREGKTLIVSMPFLMGLKAAGIDRSDMVYPYGQVRDARGQIVGCRGFAQIV